MAFRRFCQAALAGDPIRVFGDGRQTRDFTYVADVVAATRAAAVAPGTAGRVYNIGGGARVSLNETLEVLAAAAGRPLDLRRQERESGDVPHTGADIRRPVRISVTCRARGSRPGCGPSSTGCRRTRWSPLRACAPSPTPAARASEVT
jgi:nucleoside-diphosphate-sugar epimerase